MPVKHEQELTDFAEAAAKLAKRRRAHSVKRFAADIAWQEYNRHAKSVP